MHPIYRLKEKNTVIFCGYRISSDQWNLACIYVKNFCILDLQGDIQKTMAKYLMEKL